LRSVPADASYVALTRRASEGVRAAREMAELISIPYGVTADELDESMRASLGVSPLQPDDLARAGIDLDGSAAVFAQDGFPTAALPIADADKLRRHIERRPNTAVTRYQGRDLRTWSSRTWTLSWVELDSWLLIRAVPRAARIDHTWLDDVVAARAGAGLGADSELADAAERGRRAIATAPGLIGLVRFDALTRELAGWRGAPPGLAACAGRAAAAAPRLVWAADFSTLGGVSWAAVDLAPGAARELREHVVAPPPPGFRAFRDEAALSVGWSVELAWLEKVRAALACPGFEEPLGDPVREATGFRAPHGWHMAANSVDLDRLSGIGAAHLVLADRDLVTAQLESIPGRSLFERTRRVAGVAVRVLSVPGLPTIMYRLAGARFTLAVGDGVMEQVLAPGGQQEQPATELAQMALHPTRLPQLGRLIGAAMEAVGTAGPDARVIAARLSRYDEAALAARLDGNSVAVFARMRIGKSSASLPIRLRRTSLW
jgi:hypothetical protein